MTAVHLIDQLTEQTVLTLYGIASYVRIHDGRVTTRAVADGSPQADSVQRLPARIELTGVIATATLPDGVRGGPGRVVDVRDGLLALQAAGTSVSVQVEGDDPVASMVVESISTERTNGADPSLRVSIAERKTAIPRQVLLAPLPAVAPGPPRSDVDLSFNVSAGPSALETDLARNTSELVNFGTFTGILGAP